MIRWLLEKLELDPQAVFYESDLKQRFGQEFEAARAARLLRRVLVGDTYAGTALGHRLLVDAEDGTFLAYDDEEPEEDPIPVSRQDTLRCRLDLDQVAARFREVNGLGGRRGSLHERLFLLGESSEEAVVLGLLRSPEGPTLLNALPTMVPGSPQIITIACPTFLPRPDFARQLESLKLDVVQLSSEDIFALPEGRRGASTAYEFDRDATVIDMNRTLSGWVGGRKPGVGQALAHIVDHVRGANLAAAAQVLDALPCEYERRRLHNLLYEGRARRKKAACSFCPQDRTKSGATSEEIG